MASSSNTASTASMTPVAEKRRVGRPSAYQKDENGNHILDENGKKILRPGMDKPKYKPRGQHNQPAQTQTRNPPRVSQASGSQTPVPRPSKELREFRDAFWMELRVQVEELHIPAEWYYVYGEETGGVKEKKAKVRHRRLMRAYRLTLAERMIAWSERMTAEEERLEGERRAEKKRRAQEARQPKRRRVPVVFEEESEYEEEEEPVSKRVRRQTRIVHEISEDDEEMETEDGEEQEEQYKPEEVEAEDEEEENSEDDGRPKLSRLDPNDIGDPIDNRFFLGYPPEADRLRSGVWRAIDWKANPKQPVDQIAPLLKQKNFKCRKNEIRPEHWQRSCEIWGLDPETGDPLENQPPTKEWLEHCQGFDKDPKTGIPFGEEEQVIAAPVIAAPVAAPVAVPSVLLKDQPMPDPSDNTPYAMAVRHCRLTGDDFPLTEQGKRLAAETAFLRGSIALNTLDESQLSPRSNLFWAIRYSKEDAARTLAWCEHDVETAARLYKEANSARSAFVERTWANDCSNLVAANFERMQREAWGNRDWNREDVEYNEFLVAAGRGCSI